MATIVLVHGIAQEQRSATVLEQDWLPALAGGVANSANHELADRIWRAGTCGEVDVRMAYYGTRFLDPGAQGGGDVDLDTAPLLPGTEELTEQLAMAWLQAAAESARDLSDRSQAQGALEMLNGQAGQAQGPRGTLGRPVLNALANLRWFAPYGMWLASQFVWKALTQVTRYLTDDDIRQHAQDQVLDHIGPETRLVIGHSLGSVVAYEAMHRASDRLAPGQTVTLITLGSPLGLKNVVYQRLRPQPSHVPAAAGRWENFAAEDDLVAARLDIAPYFPAAPGSTVTSNSHIVDTGSQPHNVIHYLTKPSVGKVVAEALA